MRSALFRDCAARYLAESRNKRSAETIVWHVQLRVSYYCRFEPQKIHDGKLASFVRDRLAAVASATTINRSLEVVGTIVRSARAYRDDDGRAWLDRTPPLTTMQPELVGNVTCHSRV